MTNDALTTKTFPQSQITLINGTVLNREDISYATRLYYRTVVKEEYSDVFDRIHRLCSDRRASPLNLPVFFNPNFKVWNAEYFNELMKEAIADIKESVDTHRAVGKLRTFCTLRELSCAYVLGIDKEAELEEGFIESRDQVERDLGKYAFEADLDSYIEEAGEYNNCESVLPDKPSLSGIVGDSANVEEEINNTISSFGLQEVMTDIDEIETGVKPNYQPLQKTRLESEVDKFIKRKTEQHNEHVSTSTNSDEDLVQLIKKVARLLPKGSSLTIVGEGA